MANFGLYGVGVYGVHVVLWCWCWCVVLCCVVLCCVVFCWCCVVLLWCGVVLLFCCVVVCCVVLCLSLHERHQSMSKSVFLRGMKNKIKGNKQCLSLALEPPLVIGLESREFEARWGLIVR